MNGNRQAKDKQNSFVFGTNPAGIAYEDLQLMTVPRYFAQGLEDSIYTEIPS